MIILIVSKYNFPPGLLSHRHGLHRHLAVLSASASPTGSSDSVEHPQVPVCVPLAAIYSLLEKKKVESMPIERNVNFYCLVILNDFFFLPEKNRFYNSGLNYRKHQNKLQILC